MHWGLDPLCLRVGVGGQGRPGMFSCCAGPNFYRCRRVGRPSWKTAVVWDLLHRRPPSKQVLAAVARSAHSATASSAGRYGLGFFFAPPRISAVVAAAVGVCCCPSPSFVIARRHRLLLPVAVVGTPVIVVLKPPPTRDPTVPGRTP